MSNVQSSEGLSRPHLLLATRKEGTLLPHVRIVPLLQDKAHINRTRSQVLAVDTARASIPVREITLAWQNIIQDGQNPGGLAVTRLVVVLKSNELRINRKPIHKPNGLRSIQGSCRYIGQHGPQCAPCYRRVGSKQANVGRPWVDQVGEESKEEQ